MVKNTTLSFMTQHDLRLRAYGSVEKRKDWTREVVAEGRGAHLIEPEDLLLALVVPTKDGRLSKAAEDLIASGFTHT